MVSSFMISALLASAAACVTQEQLLRLEQRVVTLEDENAAWRQHFGKHLDKVNKPVTIDSDGSVHASSGTRRLSATPNADYISVPAIQLHEFPTGHTCPNAAPGYKVLGALDAAGNMDWGPTPTVPTANISLAAVSAGWISTPIQDFAAPFKVVHDASCASPPTFELQLSTTAHAVAVSDTLSVGSIDVGARITALEARPLPATPPSWYALTSGFGNSDTPSNVAWMVKDGMAFLSGSVTFGTNDFYTGQTQTFLTLPYSLTPIHTQYCILSAHPRPNGYCVMEFHFSGAGTLVCTASGSNAMSEVNFSGCNYRIAAQP